MNEITSTQYINGTLALRRHIEGAFIELGERLYNIKKDEMWEGMYNSFSEFLVDLAISDAQASKLSQIYQKFVLDYKIDVPRLAKIGQKRLYEIIPMITDKNSLASVLERIEGLSSDDVVAIAREHKHGEHKHQDEKFVICKICRRMKRIYD